MATDPRAKIEGYGGCNGIAALMLEYVSMIHSFVIQSSST